MSDVHIPLEIIRDVLLKVHAGSLLRCKAVCKSWRALISDPQFVKSHLALETTNYGVIHLTHINHNDVDVDYDYNDDVEFTTKVNILGSCNGLLLLKSNNKPNATFLWNPTSRECKRLDFFSDAPRLHYHYSNFYGLGYDSLLGKYTAVIAYYDTCPDSPENVVFTSIQVYVNRGGSSSGWEQGRILHMRFNYDLGHNRSAGLTLNGHPHWSLTCLTFKDFSQIIYFDVLEESFKRVPQPDSLERTRFDIAVLGGSLCVVHIHQLVVDIWTMKEYGVKESWTKLFAITQSVRQLNPLGFTKNGDKVVMVLDTKKIVVYDPKTGSITPTMLAREGYGFQGFAYVDSLISPP